MDVEQIEALIANRINNLAIETATSLLLLAQAVAEETQGDSMVILQNLAKRLQASGSPRGPLFDALGFVLRP